MPPRFAYWTIILDDAPTSFRTKEREEILPLFNQLKAKNPSALLKWFSGGKLWDSPEQAREARELEKVRQFREERAREQAQAKEVAGFMTRSSGRPRPPHAGQETGAGEDPLAEFRRQHGRPADGSDDPSTKPPRDPRAWSPGSSEGRQPPREPRVSRPGGTAPGSPKAQGGDRRGKDWRPGGEHRDPRDKYKLPPGEARKRWKERNLGPRAPKPFGSKPGGDRPWNDKPQGPKPFGGKPGGDRPWSDRPRGPKPFGSKPGGNRRWGAESSETGERRGPKRPWSPKPDRSQGPGSAGPGSPKAPRFRGPKPPRGPKRNG
jgi:hypothetical protein